jgi:hypothetical protein
MKLLYCPKCHDVFTLRYHVKSCECGDVKGRYEPNGSDAVVNGNGVSIAMGTGSFEQAVNTAPMMRADWRADQTEWYRYYISSTPHIILAWARPHDGPTNARTRVDPTL